MKQPELGKKIADLRKEKNLTQEELVELCNVSVRTIQRIESGEVTPRSSTLKIILLALDQDIHDFSQKENHASVKHWFKNILLIDFEKTYSLHSTRNQLAIAWIAGLLYFITAFLETVVDYARIEDGTWAISKSAYIVVKSVVLISFTAFLRGFIILGYLFKNYLLKISSYFMIFVVLLVVGYDIGSVLYNEVAEDFMMAKGAQAVAVGGIQIIFGVALIRLKNGIGNLSKFAGIFEIIAGISFVTVILSFLGLILLIPAEILEIIILFKSYELIKKDDPAIV
ncbi:helix-turn-helix transcriptional regulator [Fulvivirgaceae bacterium BMA10]|uniref:Helix-turn-helix transcriptional regulator n=1 Tax=Splendidivirga corallicola TaxID=3051826 RepID=A0ABT8KNI6_9BACT|nr:helix-turn-helix transcriptional regulator [Fulvivirgaceae bacterium BMA10]